jgi:hypothetical protein
MLLDNVISGSYTRDDGFGTRHLVEDGSLGQVEVLELVPALATPAAERALRARVEQLQGFGAPLIVPAYRVERKGKALLLVSSATDGVPLCELLAALEFGMLTLPDDAVLELAAVTVRAVGAMHEMLGPLSHGSLNPAHVVLQRDGTVALTDAVFGGALQQLQLNREELWRRFSLAMPSAATSARFDRRNDVTQLGSIIVAILLRRTLLAHEYPRCIGDLVMTAAAENSAAPAGVPRMRTWLQQALQLQPRAVFSSAVEAAQAFADVIANVRPDLDGAVTLHAAIRRLLGEPAVDPQPQALPEPQASDPLVEEVAPAQQQPAQTAQPAPRGFSFLRSVLPHLRGN